ncbi:ribosomal protein S18-alanine N-acetyltransferase [Geoalkalibacter sp.]|uniref:ribosomal protein S18-alanine N-acetyltransferase n=1 Tax=Geoalkalibacter sp. TaxID=3041440 RepID=UPI00272EC744|nr:ribosomal protein S18-alanine N-acetyltransferase [Geoalkalibacter sp.]
MNSVDIRPMTRADLPAVLEVERSGFSHPWTEAMFVAELDNPRARIDLLSLDGRLAAYLCTWYLCAELHVLNLVTAPAFRRRGLARRLLDEAVKRSRPLGLERVLLEVRVGNVAAITLYESCGFVRDGVRKRYYPDGEDALLMTLKIDSVLSHD